MNIFENLENLQVSEECFDSILDIVESILNERVTVGDVQKAAENSLPSREAEFKKQTGDVDALPVNPHGYAIARDRYFSAKKMAEELPKGDKRDYAKLRKAARKVRLDRDEEAENAYAYSRPNPERDRLDDRSKKADLFALDGKGKVK